MRLVISLLVVVLAGCSLKVAAPEPEIPMPSGWAYADTDARVPPARWWTGFGSAELDALVGRALAASPDINSASARVRQADARLAEAGAGLWPRLGIGVEGARRGELDTRSSGTAAYGATLSASYEVDLWGRLRAGRTAAAASRDATLYQRDTVRTTVVAGVVETYLRVLALRERIAVARDNLEAAGQVLEIVEARYRNGATSALALAQQRAQVASQRAGLAPLEQQERVALAALALLVGQAPRDFRVLATDLAEVRLPEVVASMPALVLARRPDVQQAEAALHAARADIRAARAALFPRLSLTGGLALTSQHMGGLFDGEPRYSLVAALVQTLFEGGRLKARGEGAVAFYEELASDYVEQVLTALSEADIALAGVRALEEQARWQAEQVQQAQRANELAGIRYRAGSEGLLTVLEAQRTLFGAEDQRLQLHLARLQSRVTLYRALGAVPPASEAGPGQSPLS